MERLGLEGDEAEIGKAAERTLLAAVSAFATGPRLLDAANAKALLSSAGSDITLSELALRWRRRHATGSGGPAAAAGAAFDSARPRSLDRFLAAFRNRYSRDQKSMRAKARQLELAALRTLGSGYPAAALTLADAESILSAFRSPFSYNGMLSMLKTAARWGAEKGICDWRFARHMPRRAVLWREPAFFSPEKVERVLRLAEAHPGPPGAAVGMRLSLGFFAGARTVEIERAKWGDLDLESGTLRIPRPKGWTCGARPRIVELEPNAVAWMRKWKESAVALGESVAAGDPVVRRPRAFAAWKRRWLAPEGLSWGQRPRPGREWTACRADSNVMRHTYATMHVGAFRDAAATALNMGHGRGSDMLEKHYRGLVPRSAATRYWSIMPSEISDGRILRRSR